MPHVSRLQTKAIDPGKRMPLLDQWDLGEWAECADEAQPGAIEEQPHELGGGEKGVGLHVAGHPCSVQLRAHIDEQSKNEKRRGRLPRGPGGLGSFLGRPLAQEQVEQADDEVEGAEQGRHQDVGVKSAGVEGAVSVDLEADAGVDSVEERAQEEPRTEEGARPRRPARRASSKSKLGAGAGATAVRRRAESGVA